MSKSFYAYPAILHYADDGISIEYPDLPGCLSCALSEEQAFKNAKEALELHLYGIEEDGEDFPPPSRVFDIKHGADEVVTLVSIFMPAVRKSMKNQFVKKTLTIPAWLNKQAEQDNINFSQTLQEALKEKL